MNLTAASRAGLLSFGYPAGSTAQVLVKSGTSHSGISAASVNIAGDDEVTGSATTDGLCNMGSYTIYFDIVFSRPFSAFGTWQGATVTAGSASATGRGSGAYLTFGTGHDTAVTAKEAISYVSVAGAKANMAAEIHGFSLGPVEQATRGAWRSALSKIQVGGGTTADLTSFYTALYHSLQFPSVFSDVSGQYIGFDNKVHTVPAGEVQYATFSDWDIYRALAPLQAMLFPEQAGDMANSLLRDAQQEGDWWPRWPAANVSTTGTMDGDSGVPLFANYAAFGGTGIDIADALPIMEKGTSQSAVLGWGWQERQCVEEYVQLGYAPDDACSQGAHGRQGVSETLEWSIDDFAISRLASAVGSRSVAQQYQLRSQNWQNVLNPATGYLQTRDSSGAFPAGPAFVTPSANAFGQDGYDEGNAADYNWEVPQNMAGLIAAMGGASVAVPRLDTYFSQLNVGPNEPYQWAGDAPPSYRTGQDAAIGMLSPTAQQGQEVVTAGQTLQATVGAQGTGRGPSTVHWTANPPAGITVTPSSGTLNVPSSGQATASVQVTVPASIASGFYPLPFSYTGADGQKAGPGNAVVLSVQAPDHTAIVADDLGSPDVPNGLTEVDQGDGQTTATTAGGLPGRTTTGSGSFYMYFKIDDSLVPGGNYQASAYVSYFDQGTASWDIQYDSASPSAAYQNSAQVTDSGTGTWKTAVIPLDGAAFSDRENGGTDFRLNIGAGGQVIGRVAVTVTGDNVLAMHLAPAQPAAPAVTAQPQDATVAAAGTATFTVASAGDPAPLVQWQSLPPGSTGWADIAGATQATLAVSGVPAAADGTQYHAVLTNLAGTVTSAAATLHVQ